MLNWFTKKYAAEITVETDEDRLRIFADEYAAAKHELDQAGEAVHVYERVHAVPPALYVRDGKAYVPVNGRCDPVHQALKNTEQHARYRFGLKLRAFTEQKIRMGLVK